MMVTKLRKQTKAELINEIVQLQKKLDNFQKHSEISSNVNNNVWFIASPYKFKVTIVNNKVDYVSYRLLDFLEINVSDLVGFSVDNFYHSIQPDGSNSNKKLRLIFRQIITGNLLSFYWQLVVNKKLYDFECTVVYSNTKRNRVFDIFLCNVSSDISYYKSNQAALKLSEAKYRNIFDNTSDLLFSCSIDGSFIYFNPAFSNALQFSDLNVLNFLDLIHPNYVQTFIELVYNSTLDSLSNVELILLKESKKYLVISGSFSFIRKSGNLNSFIGSFKDVSILKLAEEAARISEDRYKSVFNQNFLGIIITGLFGDIIQVNTKFIDIFGIGNVDISGFNIVDVLSFGEQSLLCANNLFISQDKKCNIHRILNNSDGIVVHINESIELVYDNYSNPNFFIFLFDDVTEKKKAEEIIVEQAAKLDALVQSSSHLIFSLDRNFLLTSFNEKFRDLFYLNFNFDPSFNMDISIFARSFMKAKSYAIFLKFHKLALLGMPNVSSNCFTLPNSNKIFWYETYIDPIILPDGNIIEVSYINHDITDKKLYDEKISQSLDEKGILLKEVHHRVKNNLQVISSILSLQSSYLEDHRMLQILQDLQNRIKSMSLIHENLYQKNDFSKLSFKEYLFHLSQNLEQSLHSINNNLLLQLDVHDFFLNLDYSIPCGLIINELITNAFKHAFPFNKKGNIVLKVFKLKKIVSISVMDNGIGFNDGFDFRHSPSLGLQLVTALVEQLSGDLKLSRNKGWSTIFTINFIYNS